jgi:phage shock protein A
VSELEAAGTFDDITQLGGGEDDIDRQLKQLSSQPAVDSELEKMKSELGSGVHPPAPAAQIAAPGAGGNPDEAEAAGAGGAQEESAQPSESGGQA